MINITDSWSHEEDVLEYYLFDDFILTGSDKLFQQYFHNKIFCDSDGQLYKVIGKTLPAQIWRKIFKFLPNVYKVKLHFEKVNQRMEVEQLRAFILQKLHQLEPNEVLAKWINQINKAKSHTEIIGTEIK